MKNTAFSLQQLGKPKTTAKAPAKAVKPTVKKRRPTTGELIESLSKYKWDFEAMKRA